MTVPAKVAARSSWADVVKGQTTPEATSIDMVPPAISSDIDLETSPEELHFVKPGARGSHECLCRGQVLSMLSQYGWLQAFTPIDHHTFWKHGGRIYFNRSDIVGRRTLAPGDIVTFYLYADSRGLGAEACQIEQTESGLRADAVEFVPAGDGCFGSTQAAHPVANMFQRMSRTLESVYVNKYGQVADINSAYFDDESSDEEGEAGGDADRESCGEESDHSSCEKTVVVRPHEEVIKAQEDVTPKSRMRSLRSAAPWRKLKSLPESAIEVTTDTTSAGETSVSETESASFMTKTAPRKTDFLNFRPPPGLSLPTEHEMPPGFFAPPGLA